MYVFCVFEGDLMNLWGVYRTRILAKEAIETLKEMYPDKVFGQAAVEVNEDSEVYEDASVWYL